MLLELQQINKSYGQQTVLKDLSLQVEAGQVFGFLGPNGAGKSTTIKILLQLVYPDSGQVLFNGAPLKEDNRDFFDNIGVMIETPALLAGMSGIDNLRYIAYLRHLDKKEVDFFALAARLGLTAADLEKKAKTYSTGMRQRLAMAMSLLHDPDILIYDEPTNGMDPHGIIEIRTFLRDLAGSGKTVFMSSHILSEVEKTCDNVCIINKGQHISSGSVQELLASQNFRDLEEAFITLTAG
jgi:ABC-type multidrug transport system ATPase subunit